MTDAEQARSLRELVRGDVLFDHFHVLVAVLVVPVRGEERWHEGKAAERGTGH